MINYSYITLHNTCYACEFQHVFCAFSFQTRHANQLTKSWIKRAAIKGNCIPSFLITSRNHMKSKERKKQRFVIIYHVFIYFWHMKDIKKPIIAISILGWPVWYAQLIPKKITSGSSQAGEKTYAWSHQIKLLLKPPMFFVLEMARCVVFSRTCGGQWTLSTPVCRLPGSNILGSQPAKSTPVDHNSKGLSTRFG